ncbi:stimulated by retinoic acid gene 8 protein-like [Conger conger]|uniref:stimulated by retinoic acid gene 8 protein-like n=1 Tax=Conger conger TaxID=82655 RepID=UPI002A5A8F89|nr:stimulated by retinoic acid gene 8 protein-like [Conger conger]
MASRRSGSPRRKKEIAEHQKERRRELQARHRATLAGLFDSLRNVVCPSEKTPAKWKILHRAKEFLQKQEACLEELLSLKDSFPADTDGPRTLQEVREEYRRLHCQRSWRPGWTGRAGSGPALLEDSDSSSSEEDPGEILGMSRDSSTSVPNIQEFEGYLLFYRQTVDRLVGAGVLPPGQTGVPVVSETIAGLWQSLPPEYRASLQPCCPRPAPLPPTPPCSSQDSLAAPGSAFQEDLLQDAYDVVQRELHLSPGDSPEMEMDLQTQSQLCSSIMAFMQTQLSQVRERRVRKSRDEWLAADEEAGFLRCTETFDDDL